MCGATQLYPDIQQLFFAISFGFTFQISTVTFVVYLLSFERKLDGVTILSSHRKRFKAHEGSLYKITVMPWRDRLLQLAPISNVEKIYIQESKPKAKVSDILLILFISFPSL